MAEKGREPLSLCYDFTEMSYISMDKKTLVVPTSLADITLEQYKRYMDLPESLDEDSRISETIHVFTGLSRGLIRKMTLKSRNEVVRLLAKAINTEDEPLRLTCALEGYKLGFVPNLDKMSFGEFVDLEETKYEPSNYERLMKILYRPVIAEQGERYEILPYDQSLDLDLDYGKMTMDCVVGAMLFFCDLGRDLLVHTMKSLKEEAEKASAQGQTSQENGVGTDASLVFLSTTLEGLMQLRKSHYISA